jgi:hypothetical protein
MQLLLLKMVLNHISSLKVIEISFFHTKNNIYERLFKLIFNQIYLIFYHLFNDKFGRHLCHN